MTNERDKTDRDELVSRTYRDLPAPRVPDHLNQRILQMAANRKNGKEGVLFATWMKPVAWAATIALSLAIVLELSEVPTTPIEVEGMTVGEAKRESTVQSTRDEFAPKDADALEQAENRARAEIGADQASVREDEPESPAEVVFEEVVLEDASPMKSAAKTNSFAASSPAAARPAARTLAADQPATEPEASLARSMEKRESDAATACDMKARQSAEDWLECIDNLRKSGAIQDADREYEAFILEYPAESAN